MPVIAAGLPVVAVHALLHHRPCAVRGDEEAVQIEIEAVLDGGAVDLGDEAARPRQAIRVEDDAVAEHLQLVRRLARMLATPAADVNAELALQRHEPALERADDAGGDPRGMPVHAHDSAERLEPERMGEPLQILVAAVMMHDRLGDHGTERGHASAEPRRHPPAMERKISAAGAIGHGFRFVRRCEQPSRKIRPSRAAVAFGHGTERDGIAWYLDRRDAVLPLMARRTAHPINRAWRRPKHEALPFVADRPAEAERTGRAQRQPKDRAEMPLVPMPADADAGRIFGAQHLRDPRWLAAKRFHARDEAGEPGWNRFASLQASQIIIIAKSERLHPPLPLERTKLEWRQWQRGDLRDQLLLDLARDEFLLVTEARRHRRGDVKQCELFGQSYSVFRSWGTCCIWVARRKRKAGEGNHCCESATAVMSKRSTTVSENVIRELKARRLIPRGNANSFGWTHLAGLAMRFVVATQDGIDTGLVPFTLRLEPAQHIIIEPKADSNFVRRHNLGLGPLLIGHGRAFPVGRGNSLDLGRVHAIETLPVCLAFQRHQAAVRLLLISFAVDQDGASLSVFHSAVAPACSLSWPR